jgi:ketosteroid isomerase-like protein
VRSSAQHDATDVLARHRRGHCISRREIGRDIRHVAPARARRFWKKQADGAWKVILDIYNTDAPS